MASALARVFDAVILADSPNASTKLLGLTLVERGVRVAGRIGARRVFVVDAATAPGALARWEDDRGDVALVVLRAGDQIVHPPLVQPLIAGSHERRIAVGPDDSYAGALWADGASAREVIAALIEAPASGDHTVVAGWADAQRIPHGAIARHVATTAVERRAATQLLLQILVKTDEDSPISKYIYRPLSRPLTRLLLHTPVTPNQVSYVVGLIGLFGCFLTALPGQTHLIWGAALVFLSGIIDGCDGEIARLKLTSSTFGAWLDTIVDELTTFSYFVAIGVHTFHLHPQPWVGASIAVGAVCYVASIYGIYYFCIVVIKRGGSQYYVGELVIVDAPDGPALAPRARVRKPRPVWMQQVGTILLYMIRRDFINLAALGLTFLNLYAVIYIGMFVGNVVAAIVIVPEHLALRRQLGELRRRGGSPRYVAA
jgi:phosphatidylglycerophosphate synthase